MNLLQVAQSNRELVRTGQARVTLTGQYVVDSIGRTALPPCRLADGGATLVQVTDETTQAAILRLHAVHPGAHVVALNFANRHHPGGGYLQGCVAQEECLCRTAPGLYASLACTAYPFRCYEDIKYTNDVVFMRDPVTHALLPRDQHVTADIITAAAPDLRWGQVPFVTDRFDEVRMQALIDAIVRLPLVLRRADDRPIHLVLGAFGCGVFMNDPKITSKLMRIVVDKYKACGAAYSSIVFAIPDKTCANHLAYQSSFA